MLANEKGVYVCNVAIFCCVLDLVDSFSCRFAVVVVVVCVMFFHNIQRPHLLVYLLAYLLILV
jgi:hypothetical protein